MAALSQPTRLVMMVMVMVGDGWEGGTDSLSAAAGDGLFHPPGLAKIRIFYFILFFYVRVRSDSDTQGIKCHRTPARWLAQMLLPLCSSFSLLNIMQQRR